MSKFWSAVVNALTPYVPGEQPKISNLIKLNTNECPYGPSPSVLAAIKAEVGDNLRLYPDPNSDALKEAVADYFNTQLGSGLSAANVFIGNGSDEILAHTFQGLLKHELPLLFPAISYSFYPVYCKLYGIEAKPVPLTDDFAINVEDYNIANGGIIVANPNAPTGCLLGLDEIETLVKNAPDSVVVIDEAYIDFGGQSAVALVEQYSNLLVIQTLSKSRALAGLRVGFAIGNTDLIEALIRVKDSFNSYPLDRLALNGAVAAIKDVDYFNDMCSKVIATRERLAQVLGELEFTVLPSAANFVFAAHASIPAKTLATSLREQSIIVRHFDKPGIDNWLRISIGTDAETDALIAALRTIL